jgi:hypothetical protein
MPFDEPSQRGFTKHGKPGAASSCHASASEATTRPGATRTPASATTARVHALSSDSERVSASEPSCGTPSISSSTGAQASRFRDP